MEPDHSPAVSSTKEPEPTRQRILEAARTEFAAHGLAGARIDRIARNASASKERLYAYYRHKAELFSAVLELNLGEFAEAMAGAGGTLPEFAGALYDHSVAHPEHLRMIDWARLERQDAVDPSWALMDRFHAEQLRGIVSLQRAGAVDSSWDPEHVSALIFGIVTCWNHEPAEALATLPVVDAGTIADRRATVVRAVERLMIPGAR
jgi:AcrR family transcriptional regulator